MSNRAVRIAMWSGPRNISTAMMRAWENRPDTAVWDEPLYAHYLAVTGVDHPGADEVMAHDETDWRAVVARACGPIPGGRTVFFQKHMAHHLLPMIDRGWLGRLQHAFLIREPREMLTSLAHKLDAITLADTGLPQQVEIFESMRRTGDQVPPVVDARDVLQSPRHTLGLLCEALGVPFDERMLSWPPGRRPSDGVWAKYWYESVERSTGFEPYRRKFDRVPDELTEVHVRCDELYAMLHSHRLR
jgi:hypothetical protein